LRDDRLVDDVEPVARPIDDDPADRPPVELDDVEACLRELRTIADGLRVELMRHDLLEYVGRKQEGELRLPRVAEQPVAELAVVAAFRAQANRAGRRGDRRRGGGGRSVGVRARHGTFTCVRVLSESWTPSRFIPISNRR